MKIAMVGLGKMGANMVRRLVAGGHEVVAYDVSPQVAIDLQAELEGVTAAGSLSEMLATLPSPGVVWMMVPHEYVEETIANLLTDGVGAGDVIIDGGNSNYRETQMRGQLLQQASVHYLDCGTSGGVWGLENGYSLMIGGTDEAIAIVRPVLESLAPSSDSGWGHVGPVGAGHFVKMVHNGIEYGMMQSFAEGMEMMNARQDMGLDLLQISNIWQHGSVVRSWLLDLIADALEQDADLSSLSDYVDDSGEGRWTIQESIDNAIPTPVLTMALQMRFRSRQTDTYSGKVLNALRAGFGGHPIKQSAHD